ncbi:MAG: hypothetical protein M1839_004515 [Geoglossum umbratile]|nr:MAG: hypothetical protein M1839_004515 [Geoglossum umbratile]
MLSAPSPSRQRVREWSQLKPLIKPWYTEQNLGYCEIYKRLVEDYKVVVRLESIKQHIDQWGWERPTDTGTAPRPQRYTATRVDKATRLLKVDILTREELAKLLTAAKLLDNRTSMVPDPVEATADVQEPIEEKPSTSSAGDPMLPAPFRSRPRRLTASTLSSIASDSTSYDKDEPIDSESESSSSYEGTEIQSGQGQLYIASLETAAAPTKVLSGRQRDRQICQGLRPAASQRGLQRWRSRERPTRGDMAIVSRQMGALSVSDAHNRVAHTMPGA